MWLSALAMALAATPASASKPPCKSHLTPSKLEALITPEA